MDIAISCSFTWTKIWIPRPQGVTITVANFHRVAQNHTRVCYMYQLLEIRKLFKHRPYSNEDIYNIPKHSSLLPNVTVSSFCPLFFVKCIDLVILIFFPIDCLCKTDDYYRFLLSYFKALLCRKFTNNEK